MRHLAQASDAQLRIGESILPIVVMDSGLALRAPRNDGEKITPSHSRGARRPKFCKALALSNQRAQGRPGARCTRDLMRNVHKKCAHEHTGPAESIRPSLRNGFTAYNALSPVNGFLATVISGTYRQLDASTAASGPHDFAVRFSAVRQGTSASTATRPAFLTIASAPHLGTGCANCKCDLPDTPSGIFLVLGLDMISENQK